MVAVLAAMQQTEMLAHQLQEERGVLDLIASPRKAVMEVLVETPEEQAKMDLQAVVKLGALAERPVRR